MRLCYIVSGIILILSITDFAVAAPVVIQEKPPRTGVDLVHIPEDATTMIGKRGGELEKLLEDTESLFPSKPEESLATRPTSSSQPSALADGPTGNGMMKMWLDITGYHKSYSFTKPEESSVIHLSSSSQPVPGTTGGPMAIEKALPSISKGPSQASSSNRAPTTADNGMMKMWLDTMGYPKSYLFAKPEMSAAHPSSISQPSGPVDGSMAIEKALPSISKGPSQVSSSNRAPTTADNGMMKMWLDITGYPKSDSFAKPGMLSATHPSSISQPLNPADGSVTVKKLRPSSPEEPSQVSGPHRVPLSAGGETNMWPNPVGQPESHYWQKSEESSPAYPSHTTSSPGSSTESEYEMGHAQPQWSPGSDSESTVSDYEIGHVWPPPRTGLQPTKSNYEMGRVRLPLSPESSSSTESDDVLSNPGPQWMGAVSSGKRKRP